MKAQPTTDTIIDKLQKIAALADRGDRCEAMAAKQQLQKLLTKHGLTLDDLRTDAPKEREIKYRSAEELKILVHVLAHVLGSKSTPLRTAKISEKAKIVYIDLTEVQFIDITSTHAYYWGCYKAEKKKLLADLSAAFIHRHNLYDSTPDDEAREDVEPLTPEQIARIVVLMGGIDGTPYRKMIEAQ